MSQNSEIKIPKQLRPYLNGNGKFYINDVWDELEGPPVFLNGKPHDIYPVSVNAKPNERGKAASV
jgi:hypothetical protein